MLPLELWLLVAGLTGWALHKKKWGLFFFGCACLTWLLLAQIVNAYLMHGSLN